MWAASSSAYGGRTTHKYLLSLTESLPKQRTVPVYADTPGAAVNLYMRPDAAWPVGVSHALDCPCRAGRSQHYFAEVLAG